MNKQYQQTFAGYKLTYMRRYFTMKEQHNEGTASAATFFY